MKKEEFQHHLAAHERWLDSEGKEGKRLHLTSACLAEYDLEKVRLDSAIFYHTNFKGARLHFTKLRNATLEKCDLRNASLHGAKLNNASLNNAVVRFTDFSLADLRGASLLGVDLRYCHFLATRMPEKTWLIVGERYDIHIMNGVYLKAGCQLHTIENWRTMTREQVEEMDGQNALNFYPRLLDILDCHMGIGARPEWVQSSH